MTKEQGSPWPACLQALAMHVEQMETRAPSIAKGMIYLVDVEDLCSIFFYPKIWCDSNDDHLKK